MGVNQFGLLVLVTNRPKVLVPLEPRSRGLLCRDLLDRRNARDAVECAVKELSGGGYAGANYLCADDKYAAVVYAGNRIEVAELDPRFAHADQRRVGRRERRASPVSPPHVDVAHARFGGDVPGGGQPGVLAEAE